MKNRLILLLLFVVVLLGVFTIKQLSRNVINIDSNENGILIYGKESIFYDGAKVTSITILDHKEQVVLRLESTKVYSFFYYLFIEEGKNRVSSKEISDSLDEFKVNGERTSEVVFDKNVKYKVIVDINGDHEFHDFEIK